MHTTARTEITLWLQIFTLSIREVIYIIIRLIVFISFERMFEILLTAPSAEEFYHGEQSIPTPRFNEKVLEIINFFDAIDSMQLQTFLSQISLLPVSRSRTPPQYETSNFVSLLVKSMHPTSHRSEKPFASYSKRAWLLIRNYPHDVV